MLQRERKLVLYIQLGSDSDGHVHRGPLCDFYALCRELLLHELNFFFFYFSADSLPTFCKKQQQTVTAIH